MNYLPFLNLRMMLEDFMHCRVWLVELVDLKIIYWNYCFLFYIGKYEVVLIYINNITKAVMVKFHNAGGLFQQKKPKKSWELKFRLIKYKTIQNLINYSKNFIISSSNVTKFICHIFYFFMTALLINIFLFENIMIK